MSAPIIRRMQVGPRRHAAHKFVGSIVKVTIEDRGLRRELTGRAVTVAISDAGSVADVLVVEANGPGYFPTAISLATIRTIEAV
jgi:hypothetical protein